MTHYKSNLRDLQFCLFEWLRIQDVSLGRGPFENLDRDTAEDALRTFDQLAREVIATSFEDGDRIPLVLESDGTVRIPEAVKRSYHAWYDGGWQYFEAPAHADGVGAPPSLGWALFELLAGANPLVAYYAFGPLIARVIDRVGTDAQRQRFVKPILEQRWGGSMMLSEPQAGSDVGAGTTRARPLDDGTWALEGTKCWITNGDFDAVDNIVHLVLARPDGAGPGTKGLSLFIVPKFWVNEDGSLGERNGIFVTGLEKKMGIKGSATCVMGLGESQVCRGFLAGEVHDGIRQMFQVIEQARMAVGIKSASTLSTAYLQALAYAKERVQGPDLARAADKTSPRVRIIEHPDVRRMLMTLKAHVEGMRALTLHTAHTQDRVELAGGHGHPDALEADRTNDLLLPLVKGYCSEKATQLLPVALQIFGGAGYVQDHPLEQYIRDQKIDTLYEGTTHIQALDLLFRKIMRDGGGTLERVLARAVEATRGDGLPFERQALGTALQEMKGILQALGEKVGHSAYHAGLHGNHVLASLAEIVIGGLLLEQASLAQAQLSGATGEDADFYRGKLEVAHFWAAEVLPSLSRVRQRIVEGDLRLMEVPESVF